MAKAVAVGMYAVAMTPDEVVRVTSAFSNVIAGLALEGITVNLRHETHEVDEHGNLQF